MNAPHHPLARIVVDQATGQKYQLIPILGSSAPPSETPTVTDIVVTVAEAASVTIAALVSARQARKYSFPRQIAYWLANNHTNATHEQIGWNLGDRDRSTVCHGIRTIDGILSRPDCQRAAEANFIIKYVQERLGLV